MINLLPPEERRALKNEYRVRVAVVAMAFTLAFELVLVFMFVPAFYSLKLSTGNLSARLEQMRGSIPPDVSGIEERMTDLRGQIELLRGEKDIILSPYLLALAKAKPAGVAISNIALETSDKPKLILKGYAATRDDLTQLRANLKKDTAHFIGAQFDARFLLREPIEFSGMEVTLKL